MHGGRKGSPSFYLLAGERLVLAEEEGVSGIIHRIWMTLSDLTPPMLRSLRLDMFWDGSPTPSASVPVGDFFGACLGRVVPFESALVSSPEGRSFTCTIPMPFRTGMRIEMANEGNENLFMLFYEIDYTLGDAVGEDSFYFHAAWRAEVPTVRGRDFDVLPLVRGRGRFLGAFTGVAADTAAWGRSWWGEGELKIRLDGDRDFPTLCGTGTEDLIGTGWGMGRYAHAHQGCHLCDIDRMRFGFYRWHLPDPVWFAREARVSIQQIGSCGPDSRETILGSGKDPRCAGPATGLPLAESRAAWNLFERSDSWTSCAFFYLSSTDSGLAPLADVGLRLAALPDVDPTEVPAMKSIPDEVRSLAKYIPGAERLGLDDLRAIREACDTLMTFAADRDEALRRSGARPPEKA